MSIKATFPTGSNSVSVTGLYQWDYGQILEIESADLGSAIAEVHFACPNMSEAIVRSCAFSNGVGTVTIPDTCLEQSSTINAWVYLISGTQGHTSKTISLPITARTRPSINRDIPVEISDRYTELIAEVNEAVDALENGNVTVARAVDAANASYAASAGNSATANYATTAGSADKATKDAKGRTLNTTYFGLGAEYTGSAKTGVEIVGRTGIQYYLATWGTNICTDAGGDYEVIASAIVAWDGTSKTACSVCIYSMNFTLTITPSGATTEGLPKATVKVYGDTGNTATTLADVTLTMRCLLAD